MFANLPFQIATRGPERVTSIAWCPTPTAAGSGDANVKVALVVPPSAGCHAVESSRVADTVGHPGASTARSKTSNLSGFTMPPGARTTSTCRRVASIDVLEEDDLRPRIGEYFERYAPITAVIRGIHMPSVAHAACTQAILTGARNETSPDVAAIVAHAHGDDVPIPYLVLGDNAFAGPYAASMGRVGATNQLVGLLDPSSAYPVIGATRGTTFAPTASDEGYIRAYTEARIERSRATRGATGYNKRRVDDFKSSRPASRTP